MRPYFKLVAVIPFLLSVSGYTQSPDPLHPAPDAQPSAARKDVLSGDQNDASTDAQRRAAQPLIEFMQLNPQLMVEVKEFIAGEAQRQGGFAQADSMTDEDVYQKINSDQVLRQKLTQYLRARGYLNESLENMSSTNTLPEQPGATEPSIGPQDGIGQLPSAGVDLDAGQFPDDGSRQPGSLPPLSRQGASAPIETQDANITDSPSVLRRPTPYNLLSLRDLYTQIPDVQRQLRRFGAELFTNRMAAGRGSFSAGPSDVPLGPDYVLGPGDQLNINIWGGLSQTLVRPIDREGRLTVLESGPIQVAGLTMATAEALVQDTLRAQYRNVRVTLTVSRLRSIRIFVVGDVERPGSYELSALASPITALFAAGGPSATGSMRTLRHYRNERLIGEIDLYEFMLHGVKANDDRLQAGDTLLVPPVGPQVAIYGAVKRQAIYELRGEKQLSQVLEDAGGITVAAALTHITINRVVANQRREEISVDASDEGAPSLDACLQSTAIKDGDRVLVGAVLPYSERVVYLQGHVARPGRIAYHDKLLINEVLHSYQDLLPEPAERGEIVRLVAPDLHPETIQFDVPAVLSGNSSIALRPFDTIRVFGRYEMDGPTVSIRGEVERPGTYPLFKGMMASQLVRAAGGFKRDALVQRADLASYELVEGDRVTIQRREIAIGDAVLKADEKSDEELKPGDILTVHQLTGWNDIGASIIIQGEVAHPGSYGFQEGERLSDVLRRAGGFRTTAYAEGAVLTRPEVANLEQKSREELIRQLESSSAAGKLSPRGTGSEEQAAMQVVQQQQEQLLTRLRNQPSTGRLVIHINSAIETWAGTSADIELRSGDVLRIPKRPQFVLVSGQVYNPSAITFTPGKSAGWYLGRAGGASTMANRKEIFIIRANGDVIGRRSNSWYEGDVLSTKLDSGDTIVVPQKIIVPSATWRNLLLTAQIATSLAIAAAVAGL